MGDDEWTWSLGFGSNMDAKALVTKKGLNVKDHTGAILRDWRMSFSLRGIPHAEPAYANVQPSPGDEVHGVAFLMDKPSMEKLDKQESGYAKVMVDMEAYDGRKIRGFVYHNEKNKDELKPTKRYLGVLIKGARQANLKPEYIARLESTPTYEPPEYIMAMRAKRPPLADLKPITRAELSAHSSPDAPDGGAWACVLGYVVKPTAGPWFPSHRGRDLTTRMLCQFHGIGMDENDDGGKPPYPIIKDLTADEVEYVTRWLDHYQAIQSTDGVNNLGQILGHLVEFREQQESGKTDWKLPKIPE